MVVLFVQVYWILKVVYEIWNRSMLGRFRLSEFKIKFITSCFGYTVRFHRQGKERNTYSAEPDRQNYSQGTKSIFLPEHGAVKFTADSENGRNLDRGDSCCLFTKLIL